MKQRSLAIATFNLLQYNANFLVWGKKSAPSKIDVA